uniref:RelA/SpoT domain-containing protein n=1 Tax=Zea mays TaxID=4577 RepID=A0A804LJL4_MAIZE
MVRVAIAGVTTAVRFQELVDWMEEQKAAFRDGSKWTEIVNLGLGSPALIMSGLLLFAIDGDLGGDGSWFFGGTRMWSRLMEVVESDPLMKPTVNLGMATAAGSLCDCELALVANRILRQKIAEDQFLDHVSVETEVRSVYKELYSIYKTTLKSKSSINEVNQVAQLRIIIKSKSCNGVGPLCTAQQICYHVLGLVHGIWTPVPQAVKDYIATPKPNGYQSLHTTAIPFLNEKDMDLIAEIGIAAHYSGRGVVSGPVQPGISSGRNAKGKVICLNNTGFALRSLELSGSDIGGGYELYVDEAKPRGDDQRGGGRSGGRSGGRFGDRSGGRRGGGRFGERSGGKDGGGRFDGRRGGRDGSRGRGGRGFVNKQSAGTPSVGKKTTFGDD